MLGGILAAVLVAWGAGGAMADGGGPCDVPTELVAVNYPAEHVHAKVKAKGPLRVLVVGSTSSTSSMAWASKGLPSAFRAYPRLLEDQLAARLPGMSVSVLDRTVAGLTAPMVLARLDGEISQAHPDLVIWEAGTTDAVRKVDVNIFGDVLGAGLDRLRGRGIDTILVDIQYSPQTDSIYDFQPYLDYLSRVGEAENANVFHRYDIMRFYTESGRFEPAAAAPADQMRNANFVHGCLAKQLATLILEASR